MKILLEVRHPAHIHHFKYLIWELKNKNHIVKIMVSQKDILIDLLKKYNFEYEVIGKNQKSILRKIVELFRQNLKVIKIIKNFKPHIMIGRPSQTITLTSFLLKINSIIFAEDDFKAVVFNGLLAYPFAKIVLAPSVTNLGIFNKKKIPYHGYQKLAYLHPKIFKPDLNKIEKYIDPSKPFFIIRFSNLCAGHDINIGGLNNEIGEKLVKKLEKQGQVLVTSERKLNNFLNKYCLSIPIEDIHHFIYFSNLYIGDSQSMAMEAAILGTPSIRFSDLAGRLNVLEELEHRYQLTFGIRTTNAERLFLKIDELIETPNLHDLFQHRKQQMLNDKIDVTAFMIWFVENYPQSVKIMKENPDYQYRFK